MKTKVNFLKLLSLAALVASTLLLKGEEVQARPGPVRPAPLPPNICRDRDRDGICNRRDPAPNRPTIPRHPTHRPGYTCRDYDRDGICNRWDPNPNRPNYPGNHRPGYTCRDYDRDGICNRWDPNPYRPNYPTYPGHHRPGYTCRDWDHDGICNRWDPNPYLPNYPRYPREHRPGYICRDWNGDGYCNRWDGFYGYNNGLGVLESQSIYQSFYAGTTVDLIQLLNLNYYYGYRITSIEIKGSATGYSDTATVQLLSEYGNFLGSTTLTQSSYGSFNHQIFLPYSHHLSGGNNGIQLFFEGDVFIEKIIVHFSL